MKNKCGIIKDLLPLYHDNICTNDSKEAVEEHLLECQECKSEYEKMCQTDYMEQNVIDSELAMRQAQSYKNVKKTNRKRTIKIVVVVAIIVAVVNLLLGIAIVSFGMLSYQNAAVCETTEIKE